MLQWWTRKAVCVFCIVLSIYHVLYGLWGHERHCTVCYSQPILGAVDDDVSGGKKCFLWLTLFGLFVRFWYNFRIVRILAHCCSVQLKMNECCCFVCVMFVPRWFIVTSTGSQRGQTQRFLMFSHDCVIVSCKTQKQCWQLIAKYLFILLIVQLISRKQLYVVITTDALSAALCVCVVSKCHFLSVFEYLIIP